MSTRELLALGTSSQVPTRYRNHNGYFLRWDDQGFLLDPGEGTQRQLLLANVAASAIHRVCVTHFHGDHCLGLGGIVQRLSLDRCPHAVTVHHPASGLVFFERLKFASHYVVASEVVSAPIEAPRAGLVLIAQTERYSLFAAKLDHSVDTVGYRLEEHPRRKFLPERLAAENITGPMVGALARDGSITVGHRTVTLDAVSVTLPGSVFAFVMDTRPCANAIALSRDADLLVMEATYTHQDRTLADAHGHSTSVGAAEVAREANARRLALTHFSQRYTDVSQHLTEAREVFSDVIALEDFSRIPIARRR